MGLIKALTDWVEERTSVNSPEMWMNTLLGGPGFATSSGQSVTPDSSLKISAVYAAVALLSQTVASLPLQVFKRRKDGGKDLATEHPLYTILHDIPNDTQSSYEFREFLEACLALRGNAYSYITRDNTGNIVSLTPLMPQNMKPEIDKGVIVYRYTDSSGKIYKFPAKDIWHLKGLALDGLEGLSPITCARESIGIAMGAEQYGAQFFGNTAVPGGILEHPGSLKPAAWQRLQESMREFSSSKRHSTLILEEGLQWKQIAMTNNDAQFLDSRKFQIEDIARFFNIPPLMLQHSEKNPIFTSTEQLTTMFGKFCILPWCRRWESSMMTTLFTAWDRKKGYFAEFNLDGLLRADVENRTKMYAMGRQWGWLSANDVRAFENMNPIEGGDEYITQPANIAGANPNKPSGGAKEGNNADTGKE